MRRHSHLHAVCVEPSACATTFCISVGMLRRAVHQHAAVLERDRVGDLAFEVELLLPADSTASPASRRGAAAIAACASPRTRCIGGSTYCCLRMRVARGEHRRQRIDRRAPFRLRRGAARGIARVREHHEHRLAEVVHRVLGEDRVVVHDRAAVVAAGDVGGAPNTSTTPGSARTASRSIAFKRAVRHRRQAERGVQGAGELGHVVDVGRLAGDVQVRRLVRVRHADAAPARGDRRRRAAAGVGSAKARSAERLRAACSSWHRRSRSPAHAPHARRRAAAARRARAFRARSAAAGCRHLRR